MTYARTLNRRIRVVCTLLAVGAGITTDFPATAEGEGGLSCGSKAATVAAKVQKIAPGVYVRQGVLGLMTAANRGAIANIGFIVGKNAVAVIDTGGSACGGARLRAAIAARTDLPIRYVINTHVHPDHIFGNAAFLADRPQFIGHHRLARAMAERGGHYVSAGRRQMGVELLKGTKIVPPTRSITGTLTLDLGERQLVLTAHEAAHTDHDLAIFDKESGTLWTGDLLFRQHIPVVDGSLLGWLRVMRELSRLKVANVVPGHGPVSEDWPHALEPQLHYLTALANDLRNSIKIGQRIDEAVAGAAQSEKAKWSLFDAFNARNATAGYAELEWE